MGKETWSIIRLELDFEPPIQNRKQRVSKQPDTKAFILKQINNWINKLKMVIDPSTQGVQKHASFKFALAFSKKEPDSINMEKAHSASNAIAILANFNMKVLDCYGNRPESDQVMKNKYNSQKKNLEILTFILN